jgi:predicted RNA-binding protein with RPS1 domain
MAMHSRGDQVTFTVTGAQPYGVLIQTEQGERGWIEREYLSEAVLHQDQWPPVGTSLRGLVLGYTSDGRIRLCLREVDGRASPDRWPPTTQS